VKNSTKRNHSGWPTMLLAHYFDRRKKTKAKKKMSTSTPSTPEIITTAAEMRTWSRKQRLAGKSVGFVPTMVWERRRSKKEELDWTPDFDISLAPSLSLNSPLFFSQPHLSPTQGCLHAGHLSLVDLARTKSDVVVVSIYVNPTQFAAHEDFGRYPRTREADRARLASRGVEAVFEPETLYHRAQRGGDEATEGGGDANNVIGAAAEEDDSSDSHDTFVSVERLSRGKLCSLSRPHFFRGVATVVAKLFNIVEPDVAAFGEKDWQQLAIIKRMARDLDFAVEVVGGAIVREGDGLALSSRNELLTEEERSRAPCIYAALLEAKRKVGGGGEGAGGAVTTAGEVAALVKRRIEEGGCSKVDYVSVVDADGLCLLPEETAICSRSKGRRTLVAVAAFFGCVRLIDNMVVAEG